MTMYNIKAMRDACKEYTDILVEKDSHIKEYIDQMNEKMDYFSKMCNFYYMNMNSVISKISEIIPEFDIGEYLKYVQMKEEEENNGQDK